MYLIYFNFFSSNTQENILPFLAGYSKIYSFTTENIDGYINEDDVMNLMEALINDYLVKQKKIFIIKDLRQINEKLFRCNLLFIRELRCRLNE